MRDCKLSIIIPFFNTEHYLEECLSSVVRATEGKGIPAEIILVDDFSSDGSLDIAKRFAEKCSFVHVLSSEKKTRGPGHARNVGLAEAHGEYIAFVDSDDVVVEDIYERALASLEYHNSDICVCSVSRLSGSKQIFSVAQNRGFSHAVSPCTTPEESPDLVFGILCWNSIVRRAYLHENKIDYPENTLYEDFLYCIKIVSNAGKISLLQNVEYLWRVRDDSTSSITQSYDEEQNFLDRAEMNRQTLSYARENVESRAVMNSLLTKILMLYPATMLSGAGRMSDEILSSRIREMAGFAHDYIPEDAYNIIPVIHEQIWRNILDGNTAEVRRAIMYYSKNYYTTPIIEKSAHFEQILNPRIIKISRRNVEHDFRQSIPICHVRSASYAESDITLHGWLYFKRISVPAVGMQNVRAYLYNDITGERIALPTQDVPATELMKTDTSVFNYDDYASHDYDYLGCGFDIILSPEKLLEEVHPGKYLIMLEYDNPLKSGERVLRGMHKNAVAKLSNLNYINANRELIISVDPRQTLQLELRETD